MKALPESQIRGTLTVLEKGAYYTARMAKGQRAEDAREHCKRLGVDWRAETFAAAKKG